MGIAGGHAYTVMGLAGGEDSKLPRLVKIRNPWGNSFEWRVCHPKNCTILLHASSQGPWSDSDIRRSKELTLKEKKVLRTGVGEWWMLYDDFTKCFTHLTICHPEPETAKRGSTRVTWEETSFKVNTIKSL